MVWSKGWVMNDPIDSVQKLGWVRFLSSKFATKQLVPKTDVKLESQRLHPCYLSQLPSPDEGLV
jgi:hypothetical protein